MRTASATASLRVRSLAVRAEDETKFHDQNARFSEAFIHGYQMTRHFLLSRGANPEAAEEIAQAAWAKGWECRNQLIHQEMLGAWVNSIAKNMLKNSLRVEKRFEALTEFTTSAPPIHRTIDFATILDRCPRRDSEIIRFYYLDGYTTEEIARKTGICPATVRVRLLRVRRALRGRLAPARSLPSFGQLNVAA